jgi:CBS domain-containing protein
MTTVRSVLQTKGHAIYSIAPEAMVIDALKLMADKNIGALLVMEGESLAGIFSERDYARKVVLKGESSRTTAVKDVMTSGVVTIRAEQSIGECMAIMTGEHIRHLPVVDLGKLIGLISIGDVVKAIIYEHESTIQQLENYITGSR